MSKYILPVSNLMLCLCMEVLICMYLSICIDIMQVICKTLYFASVPSCCVLQIYRIRVTVFLYRVHGASQVCLCLRLRLRFLVTNASIGKLKYVGSENELVTYIYDHTLKNLNLVN